MTIFNIWDVIAVPFPGAGPAARHRRPALVVAANMIQDDHGLLWILMITSAKNRGWRGDVAISNLSAAGLPAPSVVRTAKIATIPAEGIERIGTLVLGDRLWVARHMFSELGRTIA